MRTRPVVLPRTPWTDLAWQANARCAGRPLSLWFAQPGSPDRQRERRAKAICAGCSVLDQCLDWALELDDRYAILGGTTPDDRTKLRRNRRLRRRRAVHA